MIKGPEAPSEAQSAEAAPREGVGFGEADGAPPQHGGMLTCIVSEILCCRLLVRFLLDTHMFGGGPLNLGPQNFGDNVTIMSLCVYTVISH